MNPVQNPAAAEVESDDENVVSEKIAEVTAAPQPVSSDPNATQAVWNPIEQVWIYTDPLTGNQFEWNNETQAYLPRVDHEELAKQQAAYVAKVEHKTAPVKSQPSTSGGVSLIALATENRFKRDHGESRVIEGEDGVKYVQQKVNKSIYAKGLPTDISEEEFIQFFSRAGIMKKDPDTGRTIAKLYRDEEGKVKGDALVTYFRPEALPNAFLLLQEAEIRPGFKVTIEEAKFKLDPNSVVKKSRRKRSKRKRPENDGDLETISGDEAGEDTGDLDDDGNRTSNNEASVNGKKGGKMSAAAAASMSGLKVVARKKKKVFDQSAELDWEEKEQKHVILKRMFRPEQASDNVHFYDELRDDIMEEVKKLGHVESVKVFERNPEGVVAVKFATGAAAEKCLKIMHGRPFDGIRITAEFYDGFSDYYVAEKDSEFERRDKDWASWLEN